MGVWVLLIPYLCCLHDLDKNIRRVIPGTLVRIRTVLRIGGVDLHDQLPAVLGAAHDGLLHLCGLGVRAAVDRRGNVLEQDARVDGVAGVLGEHRDGARGEERPLVAARVPRVGRHGPEPRARVGALPVEADRVGRVLQVGHVNALGLAPRDAVADEASPFEAGLARLE